jgi:hypothetical protein
MWILVVVVLANNAESVDQIGPLGDLNECINAADIVQSASSEIKPLFCAHSARNYMPMHVFDHE